jgi:AcrR family transcriptional regulator
MKKAARPTPVPPVPRWKRRPAAETSSAIRRAALRCFARAGVDGSTTRDIAREMGLTEGALYRHFASKDEIARSVFEECAGKLVARLEGGIAGARGFAARVEAAVRAFFEFAAEDEASFRLLAHDHFSKLGLVRAGTRLPKDVIVDLCRSAPASLALEEPVLAAAFVIGIILRSIQFRQAGLVKLDPEEFLAHVVRAALRVLEVQP